jgi:hypothetical protein
VRLMHREYIRFTYKMVCGRCKAVFLFADPDEWTEWARETDHGDRGLVIFDVEIGGRTEFNEGEAVY